MPFWAELTIGAGVTDPWMGQDIVVEPVKSLAGGRYVLGSVLGRGGMADVRRATDTVLHRQVAVKLFRDDLDEASAERARAEMRTLASLAHPGLVAIHDAGTGPEVDGWAQPYLVMELVEGPTLAAFCLDGSLSPDGVRQIGAELALALAHVHAQGVVHRDVKPANILLSPVGAKLADFGIARIVDGARHTATGLTLGTAPYLAPEQVTGGPVGPPADVYALGLVLLECLTGRREYVGTEVETAVARLHRQPVVPSTLPAPLADLLRSMTALDPAARPTAARVAVTLIGGDARDEADTTVVGFRTGPDPETVLPGTAVLPSTTVSPPTTTLPSTTVLSTTTTATSGLVAATPTRAAAFSRPERGARRQDRTVPGVGTSLPLKGLLIAGAAAVALLVGVLSLGTGSGSGLARPTQTTPGAAAKPSVTPTTAAASLTSRQVAERQKLDEHLAELDKAVHP